MWRTKILAKIILSRIPFGYAFWQKLGLFRLGKMDQADYALTVFHVHLKAAFPDGMPPGLTVLELGPGDSLASALIAAAHGAEKIILADVGDYARRDIDLYKAMAEDLRRRGYHVPDLSGARTIGDMLRILKTEYLTEGMKSLRALPDRSVDFIWSHSVLEHVRKKDFLETMRQLHRILKPGGLASHNVNLKDHINEALNNLRFTEELWESDFFTRSGFYTNRLRAFQMRDLITEAGFRIRDFETGAWPVLPTPRKALHPDFQKLTDQELMIRSIHTILTP